MPSDRIQGLQFAQVSRVSHRPDRVATTKSRGPVESLVPYEHNSPAQNCGEVAERLNALVLKTSKG